METTDMATITFDENEDPVAEARALATTLDLWLREAGPPTEPVKPAKSYFTYRDETGMNLKALVVTLGDT
ncbi:hypothetical protein D9M71_709730 [compost metagenome]